MKKRFNSPTTRRVKIGIRLKLTLSFLLLISVLVAAFIAFSIHHTRHSMTTEINKRGLAVSLTFSQMVTTYILEADYVTIMDNAQALLTHQAVHSVVVTDRKGRVVVRAGDRPNDQFARDPFYANLLKGERQGIRQRTYLRGGSQILETVSPVSALGRVEYLLSIETSLDVIEAELAESRQQIWLIALGAGLLALAVATLLAREITLPLKRLLSGAEAISQGELKQSIQVKTADEMAELAAAFNRMAANLSEELQRRKAKEADLRTSMETFRKVMDSIDAHIYASDLTTHEILFMNRNLQQTLGRDCTGEKCWEAIRKKKAPCENCRRHRLANALEESDRPAVWEEQSPNTGRWYLVQDRVITWQDGRDAYLQVAADITQLKKLEKERLGMEKQLRFSQKMEAIGTLAGGIAHDFNNILSPILGYAEMAIEDARDQPQLKNSIEQIHTAGRRAKELVQQILAFSRQEQKEVQPVALPTVIKEPLTLLRSSLPASIRFDEKIDGDCAPILADPTQIHQIMMNLGINASHAMEEGGTLTVAVSQVNLTPEAATRHNLEAGQYLQWIVSDTGTGIPAKIKSRIFDPYFTTKAEGKGTGMGLSLVHSIVQGAGGSLGVDSQPDKGSRFTILWPIASQALQPAAEEDRAIDIRSGSGRILVVDDEAPVVEMISDMLKRAGHSVTAYTSSTDALDQFMAAPGNFDLLITNLTMPDLSGEALASQVTAARSDLPVVLISGAKEKLAAIRPEAFGIARTLAKPIIRRQLLETVQQLLDEADPSA